MEDVKSDEDEAEVQEEVQEGGLVGGILKFGSFILIGIGVLAGIGVIANLFSDKAVESLEDLYKSVVDSQGRQVPRDQLERFLSNNPNAAKELIELCGAQLELVDRDERVLREQIRELRDNLRRVMHKALAKRHSEAAEEIGKSSGVAFAEAS